MQAPVAITELIDDPNYPTTKDEWEKLATSRGASLCILVAALTYLEKYSDADTLNTIFGYMHGVKEDPNILINFNIGEQWLTAK